MSVLPKATQQRTQVATTQPLSHSTSQLLGFSPHLTSPALGLGQKGAESSRCHSRNHTSDKSWISQVGSLRAEA